MAVAMLLTRTIAMAMAEIAPIFELRPAALAGEAAGAAAVRPAFTALTRLS